MYLRTLRRKIVQIGSSYMVEYTIEYTNGIGHDTGDLYDSWQEAYWELMDDQLR